MLKYVVVLLATVTCSTVAEAEIGMAGSAKRLCADSGFLPPSRDFYECAHTAIIIRSPYIHYELTGPFANGANTSSPAGSQTIQPLSGSVTKGMAAYNAGDYDTALARWLPKAKQGNADAQNNMGILFENGLTSQTPKDDERAADWYLLAARQGHVLAMENLARVQIRLGHADSAQTWINLASSARQQQAANQQQGLALVGYALGCAIGGGCASYTTTITRSQTPTSMRAPAPPTPVKPPLVCRESPLFTDIYGKPKIECR